MNIMDNHELEKKLYEYEGEDKVISGKELLNKIKTQPKPSLHFVSKIPSLDHILGGFYGTQLITVSGTTGHGKTTLCQTFTMSAMEHDLKPIWFSYEVDNEDFINQFDKDFHRHMYFPSKMTGKDTTWIEQRVLEAKLKYNTQVVFIDHLHFLLDMGKAQNVSFSIGNTVRNLKTIAKEKNIIVFLVAHTVKPKQDQELGLGDARDSSFVEQESDAVLYVWRDPEKDYRSIVKVAKNRKKGIINKKIRLRFEGGRLFEEVSSANF